MGDVIDFARGKLRLQLLRSLVCVICGAKNCKLTHRMIDEKVGRMFCDSCLQAAANAK